MTSIDKKVMTEVLPPMPNQNRATFDNRSTHIRRFYLRHGIGDYTKGGRADNL